MHDGIDVSSYQSTLTLLSLPTHNNEISHATPRATRHVSELHLSVCSEATHIIFD